MTQQNPAIHAQASTPGNDVAVVAVPPAQPPASVPKPDQGQSDGKVTIDLKEYRDLQRAKARTLSFDKRVAIRGKNLNQPANFDGVDDPAIIEKLNESETLRKDAEKRALQSEVRGKVRDLLEKDEFKVLPKSTKEVILLNPHLLTEAETLDEAMLDIEDWVRDQVITIEMPADNRGVDQKIPQPAGHQAPPVVTPGAPAPANASGMEDLSNLRGPARSQAAIRNIIKSKKGVQAV